MVGVDGSLKSLIEDVLEKLKNELRKYNIFYIDDIHGEWAYVDN
jgi:chromosomal replication initiation ATPase DnaA